MAEVVVHFCSKSEPLEGLQDGGIAEGRGGKGTTGLRVDSGRADQFASDDDSSSLRRQQAMASTGASAMGITGTLALGRHATAARAEGV